MTCILITPTLMFAETLSEDSAKQVTTLHRVLCSILYCKAVQATVGVGGHELRRVVQAALQALASVSGIVLQILASLPIPTHTKS
jgi:hypothetical protein